MVLPDVEAAVTAMVRRWQRELCEVQQKYGFELVEDTMRWLEGQVDAAGGGPCAVADGRGLVGCSRELKEQDEVLGGGATGEVAIRLSTILARHKLSSVVARWCARVARGRATMAGSAQQRRTEQMSSRECRRWRKACMRRLARAWWAGTRRETATVLVRRWECVVRERNKRRVAALAAMAVSAQCKPRAGPACTIGILGDALIQGFTSTALITRPAGFSAPRVDKPASISTTHIRSFISTIIT